MTDTALTPSGSCSCGKATLDITGSPLIRAYCHCLICQSFNNAACADIVAFYRKDVSLQEESSTEFRVHKQPPFLRRGTCRVCGNPSIEKLNIPGLPGITIVPAANLSQNLLTIQPKLHIFYHRRIADANDDLPKYSGFLSSQIGLSVALIKAILNSAR